MYRNTIPARAAAVLLCCFTNLSHAQHVHDLEEVVVTARPLGSRGADHIPQPVAVITGDELSEKVTSSIGETLAGEPGVSAGDFGQGASRPIIRGLGGSRVRILENGIGSLDASTVSADHAVSIEPMHAEQIEILRGPATLLYGSDAFGGLVNIANGRLPIDPAVTTGLELDARYNTVMNEKSAALRADLDLDALALHADGLVRDTHDYHAADGRVSNSALSTRDLNFGAGLRGEAGHLAASLGRYASRYGIPPPVTDPGERVFIDLEQNRMDLSGQLNGPLPGVESMTARAGYVDYEHTEFEGPQEPGTRITNDEWELRTELRHARVAGWGGTIGMQYRNRSFNASGEEAYIPGTKGRSTGVFLLEDADVGDLHFEVGGRYEHVRSSPSGSSGLDAVDHDLFSMSAGLLWSMHPELDLGIALTRAQRAPAPEELFSNGPHLATGTWEEGNPDLGRETAHNIDLSLRRPDGRWTWAVSLFVNYIDDFIYQQYLDEDGNGAADLVDGERLPGGELLLLEYRQADAWLYGLEAQTRLEVFDDQRGHLDLRLWGDWVRAHLQDGDDLPRITPPRIGGGMEYNRGRWHLDAGITGVFRQSRNGDLETETPGYVLLDAGLGVDLYPALPSANLFIRGRNLLDQDARRHTSFLKDRAPLPGRTLLAGLSLDW